MIGRLPISLIAALAWAQSSLAVPADPTITAPAELPKRQDAANFIGYLSVSGTYYSETCNSGLTWYQNGPYAQCCPASLASCYAPTACVSGSIIYPYPDKGTTSTIPCTANFGNTAYSICNTAFIYESFGDNSPKTDIVCGQSSVVWSYWRKLPATATEIVSSAAPTSQPQQASSQLSNLVGPASASVSPSSSPAPSSGSSSKAWIAGAVVGPVVGLALIGALIFFCLSRRKKKTNNAAGAPGSQPPVQQYEGKPAVAGSFAPNSPGYGQQPVSPVPGYATPYNAPGSPPPGVGGVEGAYAPQEQKHVYQHMAPGQPTSPTHPQAAELGGASSPITGTHTAELPGQAGHA